MQTMQTMHASHDRRVSFTRRLGLWVTIAALATLISGSALAHGPRRGHGHGQRHKHHVDHCVRHEHGHARGVVRGSVGFVVPLRIQSVARVRYEPYYHASIYYAPHRHQHAEYYFPVLTAQGYVYEPRSYCGDGLFTGYAGYDGPRVSVRLAF